MEAIASTHPLPAVPGAFQRLTARLQVWLPKGQMLPDGEWSRRHKLLLTWVWLQVPGLGLYALLAGYSVFHSFLHVAAIAGLAGVAMLPLQSRRMKTCLVALGLLTGAALLVHTGHGLIELHFYFFVVIVALTLYEDWTAFLLAVAYVALHHGVFGALDRSAVYDHGGDPWKWAGIHAAFVLAAGGFAVAAWRLNEDVRVAQLKAEEERVAAEAESGRLKAEFFALVSHELRTPLTSITGYLGILEESGVESLNDAGQRSVEVIGRNTDRLQRLVEDLLLLTQVDAGTFHVELSPISLDTIARDAIEAMTPRATDGEVRLSLDLHPVPEAEGDASRVAQVLDNLLSNAIKFTPPGGEVQLRLRGEAGRAVIEVEDTGAGISAEELKHVFDRFFRAAEAMSNHIQGVGLGLAITKVIVEAHGGRIALRSDEGKGTLVRLELPLGKPQQHVPNAANGTRRVPAAGRSLTSVAS